MSFVQIKGGLKLADIFEDMYLNERLVDVTLSCFDGQLQAHRLVLAACSSYFSDLFDKLSNPFHYPVVVIKDMRIEDLKLIIGYMYKGSLVVEKERLDGLLKSAANLQINGLPKYYNMNSNNNYDSNIDVSELTSNHINNSNTSNQRYKRPKKGPANSITGSSGSNTNSSSSSSSNLKHDYQYQNIFAHPEKLLEQSMTVSGETLADNNHFPYSTNNDPISIRNLSSQTLTNQSPTSVVNVQHLNSMDQHNHQLSNQLQVLSNSLVAHRSDSMSSGTAATGSSVGIGNGGAGGGGGGQSGEVQSIQQESRPRGVHPCNICWKTFREKANLKRHLQVHSNDRVIYACPDCNKTFSWKDNYIRHTKAAHQVRQQS